MDGNLWAGNQVIRNDPRPQNNNGRRFMEFLDRNPHLFVVNNLSICEGVITRKRISNGKLEQSILDFFIVCNLVLPFVTRMVIDEERKYVLTNYEHERKEGKANDTDHATEYMDVKFEVITEKPVRKEIWNLKCPESQKALKKQTSETKEFSNCFQNELPLITQMEKWKNVLNENIKLTFKKIRIKNSQKVLIQPEMSKLISSRNNLLQEGGNKKDIEKLEIAIGDIEAECNRNKIMTHFRSYSEDPENIHLNQVWKTLKKLGPKLKQKIPSAKKNHSGRLISEPKKLKQLLVKEYKNRLRARPARPDFVNLEKRKNRIFQLKMQIASKNKSKLWTMDDLEKALRTLKINRSRDPEGLINEIFKKKVIGSDLKNSLLMMFNKIKEEQIIPLFMNNANITTVPKRGSRLLLENERGINGIIHEVLSKKKNSPVLLQIYDYRQMFDAIGLEEAISDAFDVGMDDDNLSLIYDANKEIQMAINTPSGLTERQILKNVVLQGDTWGSLLASIQVDNICRDIANSGYGYKYKDVLPVSLLALVDDLIGISYAGYRAQQMNVAINIKTAEKRLQFGVNKCKTMIVGKNYEEEMNNPTLVDKWKLEYLEESINQLENNYDICETYDGEVEMEKTQKQKYLGFILSTKGDNMDNISEMKNKSVWIINKILDKLKTLNLRKYYFECALIFLNIILRTSILYASETYYNLKENEMRALERIEEQFLRKIFKTTKACPISQLYLEAGHYPARFEIFRRRLLFFKSILNEKPDNLLYRFVQLQLENPVKGDWASSCLKSLEYLDLTLSIADIKDMSKNQFRNILKKSIKEKALQYLIDKRGSKGKEIEYSRLKMAEYLLPQDENISISDQQYIFSMITDLVNVTVNLTERTLDKISPD